MSDVKPFTFMHDTPLEAKRAYYAAMHRLTPEEKLQRAQTLSRMARDVAMQGIRDRHPEYDDEQVRHAYIKMLVGGRTFEQLYPGVDVEP